MHGRRKEVYERKMVGSVWHMRGGTVSMEEKKKIVKALAYTIASEAGLKRE